jgi:hypothetical protein
MKAPIKNKLIMKTSITTGILLFSLLYTFSIQAQVKDYNENVTVIAPFQPTISDANKLNSQPVFTDTTIIIPKLEYLTLTRKYKTSFAAEPIKAARVGEATLTKLYKFLLKAGFGNYTMPYGEFFVNNTYSRSYSVGAYLKHLSASGKLKGWAYPGNSENIVKFYGKKIFKKHIMGGSMAYNRNVYHYYGFKPDDFINDTLFIIPTDRNTYKQRFNLISANINFNTMNPPDATKLNYGFILNYYYLNDYFKTAENNIDFTADVNKDLHLFKFTGSQILGITAQVNYFFGQDTALTYNAGIVKLYPYIKTTFKGFAFNLGLDISTEVDSLTKLHFYPVADVQFNVVKNILIVFAGIKGNLEQNSFHSLATENPFVESKTQLYASSKVYDIYGGIKSNISRTLNFSASASYSNIKNMPLFVTDTMLYFKNKFMVIYDNAKLLRVTGEFAFQKDEKYKLLIGGNFYNYKMSAELKAWHKPIFDAYIDFYYNISNKFIISSSITGRSNVYAKSYEGVNVVKKTLNGYADISLGFEYRYSKILSAFLNINNLTSIKYYKWNNYPSYGFNLMGGVTYAF